VTSAQFLIDSETNLQAAMQSMAGGEAAPATTPATTQTGPTPTPAALDIAFRIQPDPPRVGENALEVTVKDAQGRSVTDADVSVVFFMPPMASMGMPAMRNSATLQHADGGVYRGKGEVLMAGRWDVTVTVSRGGQSLGSKRLAIVVR
jgi:Cu(I)/Ag(I) efflux system membrane fusion protein